MPGPQGESVLRTVLTDSDFGGSHRQVSIMNQAATHIKKRTQKEVKNKVRKKEYDWSGSTSTHSMCQVLRIDHALFASSRGKLGLKCCESLAIIMIISLATASAFIAHCWPGPLRISASPPSSLPQLLLRQRKHRRRTPPSSWNAQLFPSVSGRQPWHQPVLGDCTSG